MSKQAAVPHKKRRANDRALAFWRNIRGDRAYPTVDDVAARAADVKDEAGELRPNVFLVYFDGDPENAVFTMGSPVLDGLLGTKTEGRKMGDALPPELKRSLLSFVRTLARARKPIAVSSRFSAEPGVGILYRSIFLPVTTAEDEVEYLLGAFSYREESAGSERPRHHRRQASR